MDSSVSQKDQFWFLRVCRHVSRWLYRNICYSIKTRNRRLCLKNICKCKFVSTFTACLFHPLKQKSRRRPRIVIGLNETHWVLNFCTLWWPFQLIILNFYVFCGATAQTGPSTPIVEVSRSHTHTHSPGRTPLDKWSARRRSTTHKLTLSVGFEPAIPPVKRLQTPRLRPHGHRDRPNFYVYIIHYDPFGNVLWRSHLFYLILVVLLYFRQNFF